MRTSIIITVNGTETLVPKDCQISYTELCRIANIDPASGPIVTYSAGPLSAGKLESEGTVPLKKYAQYNVSAKR